MQDEGCGILQWSVTRVAVSVSQQVIRPVFQTLSFCCIFPITPNQNYIIAYLLSCGIWDSIVSALMTFVRAYTVRFYFSVHAQHGKLKYVRQSFHKQSDKHCAKTVKLNREVFTPPHVLSREAIRWYNCNNSTAEASNGMSVLRWLRSTFGQRGSHISQSG